MLSGLRGILEHVVTHLLSTSSFFDINKCVYKKIASHIDDEDIRSAIISWLQIQNPPQLTSPKLRQLVITKILSDQEIIIFNTEIS